LYGFAEVWQTGWGASGQWLIIAAFLPHYLFLQTTPKRKNMLVVITMLMLWFSCVLGTVNGVQLTAPREYILRAVNVVVISVGVLLEVRMADITAATNQKERQKYIRSLELDSQRDPLTGLWNRRYADHYFSNLPDSDRLMCFVLADIDRFKAINDTYGHNTGDEVLRFFADAMQNRFRTSDAIIRWGGEEFLIILHGISVSTGLGIINKFREHIAGQKVETDGGVIRFTATFGIAEYTPAGKTSVEDVIAQCDLCLYHGKKNGRNQTVTPDLIDQET
jgi:diguanylate cyclase (GGDEF)-like protein